MRIPQWIVRYMSSGYNFNGAVEISEGIIMISLLHNTIDSTLFIEL